MTSVASILWKKSLCLLRPRRHFPPWGTSFQTRQWTWFVPRFPVKQPCRPGGIPAATLLGSLAGRGEGLARPGGGPAYVLQQHAESVVSCWPVLAREMRPDPRWPE